MKMRHRFNRLSVRFQWILRELETDRLQQRFDNVARIDAASRDEQLDSARSMLQALLRREGL